MAKHSWLFVLGLSCERPTASIPLESQDTQGIESGTMETAIPDSGDDTGTIGVSFRAVLVPIYAQKCESCHDYWGSSGDPSALWERFVEDGAQNLIQPGDPANSVFYTKMLSTDHPDFPSGKRMPYEAESVSSSELSRLSTWINDGASEEGFNAYTEIHEEFDYQCKNCHDYFGASTVDDMYETLLASEVNGMLLLEPGDAEGSLVYVKLAGGTQPFGDSMPLHHGPISEAELDLIEQWIQDGAPDN